MFWKYQFKWFLLSLWLFDSKNRNETGWLTRKKDNQWSKFQCKKQVVISSVTTARIVKLITIYKVVRHTHRNGAVTQYILCEHTVRWRWYNDQIYLILIFIWVIIILHLAFMISIALHWQPRETFVNSVASSSQLFGTPRQQSLATELAE